MVVNAPTSNIISAAELTVGHILSLARHIPAAHAALAQGQWKRSKYTGIELYEKTVGIIGLGRIGALITARLQAFGVERHRLRPLHHLRAGAAARRAARSRLDELLEQSDFITIHMPKTPETTGMIGTEQFAKMKPTAYIVNVARGGLIDEDALHEALIDGHHRRRRPRRLRHRAADRLAAARPRRTSSSRRTSAPPPTRRRRRRASRSPSRCASRSAGELVPDAVNVAGGVIDPYVRPGIPLVEKLGQVFAGLAARARSRASTSRCAASSPTTT